jgi:hypothetical protein
VVVLAALVFGITALVASAFQVALAVGAPWGEFAMGGRHPGPLPRALRAAAVGQAILLAALALIVLSRAGVIEAPLDAPWLSWLAVGFSAVSLVLNAISRSPGERRLWVPAAVVMLGSSLVVAVS